MIIISKTSSEMVLHQDGYLQLIVGGLFTLSGLSVGIFIYQNNWPLPIIMCILIGIFAILSTRFITIKIDKLTKYITITYTRIGKRVIQQIPFDQIESIGVAEHMNNGFTLDFYIVLKSNEYYLFTLGNLSEYTKATSQEVAQFIGVQLIDYSEDIGVVIRERKQVGMPIFRERKPSF